MLPRFTKSPLSPTRDAEAAKRFSSEHGSPLIKRLMKPGMGFFSFETAWRTLQGFEVMNMIRKGQVQGVAKGDVRGQVALVAKLFGLVA